MKNIGKKPHKFTYTYQDIADLAGLSMGTVYNYAHKGTFNPDKLSSVIMFINAARTSSL